MVLSRLVSPPRGISVGSSTHTGNRLETIDYIFYDEALMVPVAGSRSPLKCPEVAIPNETEPSDHIPISVTFRLKEETDDLGSTLLALEASLLVTGVPPPETWSIL